MGDGLLSLTWNNHRSTFCSVIANLKRKEVYSDATLACDGRFYPVHKLVLSTCSDYFQNMLEKTPCKHPVIVLRDVQPGDLESLLGYMYDGAVSVAQDDLARFIKVAEMLRIKGLAVPDDPPPKTERDFESSRAHADEKNSSSSRKRKKRRFSGQASIAETPSQRKRSFHESEDDDIEELVMPVIKQELVEEESTQEVEANQRVLQEPLTVDTKENILTQESNQETYTVDTSQEAYNLEESGMDMFDPSLLAEENGQLPGSSGMSSWSDNYMEGSDFSSVENQQVDMQGANIQRPPVSGVGLSGPGNWRCPFCSYVTFHKPRFRNHVMAHRKVRPYKCHLCSFSATQKGNLNSHILRKHQNFGQ